MRVYMRKGQFSCLEGLFVFQIQYVSINYQVSYVGFIES